MATWFLDVLGVTDGTVLDNFASFLIFPPPSMFSLHTPKTKKNHGNHHPSPHLHPWKFPIESEKSMASELESPLPPASFLSMFPMVNFSGECEFSPVRGKLLQPRISWCWCAILSDAPTSATRNNDTARCQRHTPKASVAPWSCGTCRGGAVVVGKTFRRAGGRPVDRRLGSSWPTWFGIAREKAGSRKPKNGRNFRLANCFFHGMLFLHVSSCFCRHLKTYLDVAMGCIFFSKRHKYWTKHGRKLVMPKFGEMSGLITWCICWVRPL